MKENLTWWPALLMGLLYVALVHVSSIIGYLHPVCWAFYTVLAGLLVLAFAE